MTFARLLKCQILNSVTFVYVFEHEFDLCNVLVTPSLADFLMFNDYMNSP